jgi:hypothetical protein
MWTLILTLVIINNSTNTNKGIHSGEGFPVSTFAQVIELNSRFRDELDCNNGGKRWVKSVSDPRVMRYYSCIWQ